MEYQANRDTTAHGFFGLDLPAQTVTGHLAQMIAGSYREMPGLKLTLAQAARLFGSDSDACREALELLTETGELRRRPQGDYVTAR